MNRTNFVQTGGFPVKAERLQELQTAYEIFNQLGNLGGNLTILSGCEVVGTTVSDGFVFINNEVLEFKAGTLADDVIIIEIPSSKEFKNGEVKPVHYERYVTFGTSVNSFPWASFSRLVSMRELQGRILPPGTNPQLYCGLVASIPSGWQLCDGTNGTPNLKGKFIVGYDPSDADYNAISKVGGEKSHQLTISEMPAHTHSYTVENTQGAGSPGAEDGISSFSTQQTGSQGGNAPHENRPPYYTLAYIIYLG